VNTIEQCGRRAALEKILATIATWHYCAWCKEWFDHDWNHLPNVGVFVHAKTHGICLKCQEQVKSQTGVQAS